MVEASEPLHFQVALLELGRQVRLKTVEIASHLIMNLRLQLSTLCVLHFDSVLDNLQKGLHAQQLVYDFVDSEGARLH